MYTECQQIACRVRSYMVNFSLGLVLRDVPCCALGMHVKEICQNLALTQSRGRSLLHQGHPGVKPLQMELLHMTCLYCSKSKPKKCGPLVHKLRQRLSFFVTCAVVRVVPG